MTRRTVGGRVVAYDLDVIKGLESVKESLARVENAIVGDGDRDAAEDIVRDDLRVDVNHLQGLLRQTREEP